jgi:hypothetical protein
MLTDVEFVPGMYIYRQTGGKAVTDHTMEE